MILESTFVHRTSKNVKAAHPVPGGGRRKILAAGFSSAPFLPGGEVHSAMRSADGIFISKPDLKDGD